MELCKPNNCELHLFMMPQRLKIMEIAISQQANGNGVNQKLISVLLCLCLIDVPASFESLHTRSIRALFCKLVHISYPTPNTPRHRFEHIDRVDSPPTHILFEFNWTDVSPASMSPLAWSPLDCLKLDLMWCSGLRYLDVWACVTLTENFRNV